MVCLPLGMWGQSPKGPLGLLVDGLGPDMADCRAMVVLRLMSTGWWVRPGSKGSQDLDSPTHPSVSFCPTWVEPDASSLLYHLCIPELVLAGWKMGPGTRGPGVGVCSLEGEG